VERKNTREEPQLSVQEPPMPVKTFPDTDSYLRDNENEVKYVNEVIPLCINSIYSLYHTIPSTQHKSKVTATCFDLSHLQAYLRTVTNYNMPVHIVITYGS